MFVACSKWVTVQITTNLLYIYPVLQVLYANAKNCVHFQGSGGIVRRGE